MHVFVSVCVDVEGWPKRATLYTKRRCVPSVPETARPVS